MPRVNIRRQAQWYADGEPPDFSPSDSQVGPPLKTLHHAEQLMMCGAAVMCPRAELPVRHGVIARMLLLLHYV
jgi:hypothetical protein